MGFYTNLSWTVDLQSDQEVSKTIVDDQARKIYKKAKGSVTQDPLTNRKSKELKSGRYKGMYRWKNPPFLAQVFFDQSKFVLGAAGQIIKPFG